MPRETLAQRWLGLERAPRVYRPAAGTPLASATNSQALQDVLAQVSKVILGKDGQIRLMLACLLARGHLLIEDQPGVGKTTLAHALASSLGLKFQRIQFTSDLLPADVIGVAVFDRHAGSFKFHAGPVFAQMILADEVNRATPKAQSALLEAMEEQQVTAEGETRPLPQPFFVIATQNPSHQIGTFPLPESQLDRFLMCIRLGYPDARAERALLEGQDRREMLAELSPCLSVEELITLQAAVRAVYAAPALYDYLQAILAYTRQSADYVTGLSPRCGINLLQAARAWALLEGRAYVIPEDVQAVLSSVVSHRLHLASGQRVADAEESARRLLNEIAIP